MSRAVRPRPVDIYKPLPIHYGFVDEKELRYEDENGFMRTIVQGDTGVHHETLVPKVEEIVVQDCEIVSEYATEPHEKFKRTNAYIKQGAAFCATVCVNVTYPLLLPAKIPDDWVEYVVEDDDMAWIDECTHTSLYHKDDLTGAVLQITKAKVLRKRYPTRRLS